VRNPAHSRFTRHDTPRHPNTRLFLVPPEPNLSFFDPLFWKIPTVFFLGTPSVVLSSTAALARCLCPVFVSTRLVGLIRFVPRSYSSLDLPTFYSPVPAIPLISSSYSFKCCLIDCKKALDTGIRVKIQFISLSNAPRHTHHIQHPAPLQPPNPILFSVLQTPYPILLQSSYPLNSHPANPKNPKKAPPHPRGAHVTTNAHRHRQISPPRLPAPSKESSDVLLANLAPRLGKRTEVQHQVVSHGVVRADTVECAFVGESRECPHAEFFEGETGVGVLWGFVRLFGVQEI